MQPPGVSPRGSCIGMARFHDDASSRRIRSGSKQAKLTCAIDDERGGSIATKFPLGLVLLQLRGRFPATYCSHK
jgi:hypothetical protein